MSVDFVMFAACPLTSSWRPNSQRAGTAASGHNRTHAPQRKAQLFVYTKCGHKGATLKHPGWKKWRNRMGAVSD